MSDVSSKFRERSWFESVYKIGVGVKGIDGLIELIVGVALWISPQIIHGVLSMLIGEASEHHNGIFRFISEYIGHADIELAKSGLALIIIFLITHGVVKLALVYCLLKRIVRAYPIALAILVAFLLYQVYVFIIQPTIGMALFTILDAIIIWLVWGEYQDLRSKK